MEYKVGDVVLVKLTITEAKGQDYMCSAGHQDQWYILPSDIVALVVRNPPHEWKEGDKVMVDGYPELGAGIINYIDEDDLDGAAFFVVWKGKGHRWASRDQLMEAE